MRKHLLQISAKEKKCNVPICNGYGQNEMAGAISLNTIKANLNGSAGFPTYGTEVLIVDPETYETLDVNEIGLIMEKSNRGKLRNDYFCSFVYLSHRT